MVELAVRLHNAGLTLRTIAGQAIVYHLDHRYVRRYRSPKTVSILNVAQRDQISRCERGLVVLPVQDPRNEASPLIPCPTSAKLTNATGIERSHLPENERIETSHFRDKIVPGSMLAPAAPSSP